MVEVGAERPPDPHDLGRARIGERQLLVTGQQLANEQRPAGAPSVLGRDHQMRNTDGLKAASIESHPTHLRTDRANDPDLVVDGDQ